MKIAPDEMRVLAQYIQTLCGISLDDSKAYLVETRLSGLAEEAGCSTFSELFYKAKSDPSKNLPRQIIDAITTGETLFFRDSTPFELLQYKILPDLIDRRKSNNADGRPITIRIWSAACSTGQEVYSIAIIIKELLRDLSRYNIRLVGTDISNRAVAQASRGIYNRVEMERGGGGAGSLDRDGYLVIGSTESLTGYSPIFESHRHLRSVYYQLKEGR